MDRSRSPAWHAAVERTLLAFGGRGTLGDLIVSTGLPRGDVERSLEELIADERAHVAVSESGELVYRLDERRRRSRPMARSRHHGLRRRKPSATADIPAVGFDRKTLRLIRARGGVLSMAELVEHTGLPLKKAQDEMERLVELYGGEAHPSWDGHIVYAFPELVVSAHGDFVGREPRPAWVRGEDPMRRFGRGRRRGSLARRLLRAVARTRRHRFRDAETLRRYALGHVFETALKGKGVVSLDGTVKVLQSRAGKRRVSRSAVEKALEQLASEFEAPITELNGDRFFGFRNVKRQFLASQVQRTRLRLERTVAGRMVFDSGDAPLVAAQRELEAFDRALGQDASLRAG
jgi:hypothetical protein